MPLLAQNDTAAIASQYGLYMSMEVQPAQITQIRLNNK